MYFFLDESGSNRFNVKKKKNKIRKKKGKGRKLKEIG